MAPSAEIMQPLPDTLPDTLPEDFSEWDNRYSAAPRSVNFNVSAAVAEEFPATRPRSHSADPQYTAVAVSNEANDLPRYTAGSFSEQDEFLLRSFRFKEAVEITPKRPIRKRTVAIVVAIVPILLLLAFFPGVYPGLRFKLAQMKQSIASLSTSPDKSLPLATPKPSPADLLTGVAESSTIAQGPLPSAKSAAGADQASHKLEQVTAPQVESKMMTDQLNAPAQIPHEITKVAPEEAPPAPGFGGASAEGLDNSSAKLVRSVLSVNNNGPMVSPDLAKPVLAKVAISSGVAAGMFLHGAKPQYPAMAKSARVSGTVVLEATISKAGTIENMRVSSGPAMLRQAALDAVSTWRYRPYLLNGQPVAIDTTISVVFNVTND